MAGNANSGRKANETVIRQNLINILDEVDPSSGRKRMMNILHKLVESAEDGKMDAIKEIADRVDGKPTQPTDNKHSLKGTLKIVNEIVRPGN